jgi:hypothetical protein
MLSVFSRYQTNKLYVYNTNLPNYIRKIETNQKEIYKAKKDKQDKQDKQDKLVLHTGNYENTGNNLLIISVIFFLYNIIK